MNCGVVKFLLHDGPCITKFDDTDGLFEVLHEFLSCILHRLQIVGKHTSLLNFSIDDIYLVVTQIPLNNKKRFDMIVAKYVFTQGSVQMFDAFGTCHRYAPDQSLHHIYNTITTMCSGQPADQYMQKVAPPVVQQTAPVKEQSLKEILSNTNNIISNISIPEPTDKRIIKTVKLVESESSSCNSDDIEELEKQLDELHGVKQKLLENVDDVKKVIEDDTENVVNYECVLRYDKMIEKQEKEKELEKINVYIADINVYKKIKKNIEDGNMKEEDVPDLFEAKFTIFDFMNNENLLSDENIEIGYDTYNVLYDSLFGRDDDYVVPEEYNTIVNKFLENLPDREIRTVEEIMDAYNSIDNIANKMFTDEDENINVSSSFLAH